MLNLMMENTTPSSQYSPSSRHNEKRCYVQMSTCWFQILLSFSMYISEIQFILDAINDYLNVKVCQSYVLSAWSGIHPLATDPSANDTANTSRDHVVSIDVSGLVTIFGGKRTTYRIMAENAVDATSKVGKLSLSNECVKALKSSFLKRVLWPIGNRYQKNKTWVFLRTR